VSGPFYSVAIAAAVIFVTAAVGIGLVGLAKFLLKAVQGRSEASRRRALAEPAARLGLMPLPPDTPLPDDLPPFELLNTGTARRASNVLRGSSGGNSVVVFDYTFYDAQTRHQRFPSLHYSNDLAGATVACVKASWLTLPEFVMEPSVGAMLKEAEEQVAKQLGDGMLATGVKRLIEAAEGALAAAPGWEYQERPDVAYRVRGPDEHAVRAVFTPQVLDYFRDHPGWIVEGRGEWLLLTFPSRMPQVAGSPSALGPVTVTVRSTSSVTDQGKLPADKLDTLVHAATATMDVFRTAVR